MTNKSLFAIIVLRKARGFFKLNGDDIMKTQYNALLELFSYRNELFWDWLENGPMVDAYDNHETAEEFFDYLDSCITTMLDFDEDFPLPADEREVLRDLKKETTIVELKYNQKFLSIVSDVLDDPNGKLFDGIEKLMTIAKLKDKEPVAS